MDLLWLLFISDSAFLKSLWAIVYHFPFSFFLLSCFENYINSFSSISAPRLDKINLILELSFFLFTVIFFLSGIIQDMYQDPSLLLEIIKPINYTFFYCTRLDPLYLIRHIVKITTSFVWCKSCWLLCNSAVNATHCLCLHLMSCMSNFLYQ
jgi:hypothetical protein